MARLFFLFSGEHDTLPVSELKAILEAEGYAFKTLEKLDQTLRLEAELECVEAIRRRAAFTRLCGFELFCCEAKESRIFENMYSASLKEIFESRDSFAIRIKRVKNHGPQVDCMALERRLGELVLDKTGAKVDLKNPNKVLSGILTDGKFIFGLKLAEIFAKPFFERRPRKKPFFHPSAMPSKLARCMVNLAKPKTGELLFDPFCGTGSMLIEGALIGCRVLGSDIKRRMVKGSLKNLAHFNIEPEGIIVADARTLPTAKIDCVVTDPPYGRSTSTFKRATKQIVEEVLQSVHDMLDNGRRVCMAAPKTLNAGCVGVDLGYKHLDSHFVYVHRSLTREIAVFEKV